MVAVGTVIGRRNSADAWVFEAVETGLANIAISDDCLIEMVSVMSRPYVIAQVKDKASATAKALTLGLNVGVMGIFMRPRRLDWPQIADPKDGWILDLALQAATEYTDREVYIISRDRGVRRDAPKSGFSVLTPPQFAGKFRPQM